MFEEQYRFYGKHADMVNELTNVFDEKTFIISVMRFPPTIAIVKQGTTLPTISWNKGICPLSEKLDVLHLKLHPTP